MSTATGHLLVVDDEEISRLMISAMLTQLGYLITSAKNGEEALARIEARAFDVVLLDVVMDGMSGLDTLARIRLIRGRLELPVIMVTANHGSRDIVDAFELGANDYVTKPVDVAVLEARVRTQIDMGQLSKLKDEFLAIASHDLKNPLTTIGMAAGMIETSVPPGAVMTDQMFAVLKTVGRSVKRMTAIVEDFVDGQALLEGRLELTIGTTDLNGLARRICSEQAAQATAKQIELQLELDPALPPFLTDEKRVTQVIENILGNAIKFSPPGCLITIRTRIQDKEALLEVCDTGPGLTESDMSRLFVKHARLSNRPTGGENSSGLGLAICKQLVELHHGQIGARNNPEHGSTFWFRLPVGVPLPESAEGADS